MMRRKVLALDYGEKRVGAALSDDERKFAVPYSVLANDASLLGNIKALIEEEDIETVVVGRPRSLDGTLGAQAKLAEEFSRKLALEGVKVALEDETGTSDLARLKMRQLGHDAERIENEVDKYAAAEILNGYLKGL